MLRQAILILLLLFAVGCVSQTKASVPAPERLPPKGGFLPKKIEVASGEPAPIEVEGLTFYIYLCMNHEFEIDGEPHSWLYCHGYLALSPDEHYLCPFMILSANGVEKFGMLDDPMADPECRKHIPLIDPHSSSQIKHYAPPQPKKPTKPKTRPPGSGVAMDQRGNSGEIQTPL